MHAEPADLSGIGLGSRIRSSLLSADRHLILWFGLVSLSMTMLVSLHSPLLPFVVGLAVAGVIGLALAVFAIDDGRALAGLVVAGMAITLIPIAVDVFMLSHQYMPDFILQPDVAAGVLLQGQDPYGHDYLSSPGFRHVLMGDQEIHYGLDHFPYAPGMFLLAVPEHFLPWPGLRSLAVLAPLAVSLLAFAAYRLGTTPAHSRALAAAVLINPLLAGVYGNLYNDVFAMAPGLLGVGFAARGRFVLAGILLGTAMAIKQDAVLLAPAIAVLALRRGGLTRVAIAAGVSAGTFALVILPFLLWNPSAFLADTVGFFFSSGLRSSPARGASLSELLLYLGISANRWETPSLTLLQVAAGLSVVAAAAANLRRTASWARIWSWTALLAFVVFFVSSVFTSSYLAIVMLFGSLATAALGPWARLTRNLPVVAAALPSLAFIMFGVLGNAAFDRLQPNPIKHPIAVGPAGVASVKGSVGDWRLAMAVPGGRTDLAPIPGGDYPLALAWQSDGDSVVVSMANGLDIYSRSQGRWRTLPYMEVTTIGADGLSWVAGQWGLGVIYSRDGGMTWHHASSPPDDVEFEVVARSGSRWLMATELGVLASEDGGASWTRRAEPLDRVTSLAVSGNRVLAAAWSGKTAESTDGGLTWRRSAPLNPGVWAVADNARLEAGATGVFFDGQRVPSFGRREAVATGSTGNLDCVALTDGAVYCSDGGPFTLLQ